jgi:hypothetical protein
VLEQLGRGATDEPMGQMNSRRKKKFQCWAMGRRCFSAGPWAAQRWLGMKEKSLSFSFSRSIFVYIFNIVFISKTFAPTGFNFREQIYTQNASRKIDYFLHVSIAKPQS